MQKTKILPFILPKYWPTWLALALLKLICLLPLQVALLVGQYLGTFAYLVSAKRRHITRKNLQLCFPTLSAAQRSELMRQSYHSLGMGIVEMALSWWLPEKKAANLLQIKGLQHLQAAKSRGKGVLLIGAHFTTLDLVGRLLALQVPVAVTYRPAKNPLINQFLEKKRRLYFQHAIARDNMRDFIRSLRNGETVWYAPDQDYGAKVSVFAPFFGITAATISTTAKLITKTHAIALPTFQYRKSDNSGYVLEFQAPLENYPCGDAIKDATLINQVIEKSILQTPEQYLWQHRRFKTRPAGKEKLY